MPDISALADRYDELKAERLPKIEAFMRGDVPYLVCLPSPTTMYGNCNSIEDSFAANLYDFEQGLDIATDGLPYLEPWFGTGAYAEAFGCEYFWRDGESPACHYKYHSLDEVKDLEKPDIRKARVLNMVLDAIAHFREKTEDRLPLVLTDTQSAHDTATMVLDACEVFVASYEAPEALPAFLSIINELIIEFSRLQADLIGPTLLSRPGHIMACSHTGGPGISISEDNIMVASPYVNEHFLLPYTNAVGAAFGGVAIHSCGCWTHSMAITRKMENVMMIDCAVGLGSDPNPNAPEDVREAMLDSGIIVSARCGSDLKRVLDTLDRLAGPGIRLVVRMGCTPENSQARYDAISRKLEDLYS